VNYSRLKVNKNSLIFSRFMTLTAYLQLNFKEIDPFILDYIRSVLYGMVRNDSMKFSRDSGKIMCKKMILLTRKLVLEP